MNKYNSWLFKGMDHRFSQNLDFIFPHFHLFSYFYPTSHNTKISKRYAVATTL